MRRLGWAIMVAGVAAITSGTRKRQARADLLAQHCVVRAGCRRVGDNMVGSLVTEFPFTPPGISSSRQSCQESCADREDCNYFTWYDRDGAFPYSCFLFSTCSQEEEDCKHCYTGPGSCRAPGQRSCPAIQEDYGGSWFCFPDTRIGQPVPHGTKCIWQCPGQSSYHQCDNGQWSEPPGSTRCMCQSIGLDHQGEVLCHPPVSMSEAVTSGTYCLHTCHGHPKAEMLCEHSLWSHNPADLSCEGRNTTAREGGRLLQGSLDLGARATQKLRQMKAHEGTAMAEMKTKIDGQILTMTKVSGRPSVTIRTQDEPQRPEVFPTAPSNLLQRLPDTFAPSQPLKSSTEAQDAVFSSLLQKLQASLSPNSFSSSASLDSPFYPPSTPSLASSDELRFQPSIALPPQDLPQSLATFPQQQEIVTAATPTDFGFHQIRSPDLAPGNLHQGPPRHQAPRVVSQVAKLRELENLLESTETLSPLTLEMVQTALVGLKEKRAEQVAVQGRNIPDRDVRSFFPDAKHISVKGEAPLLMPHPGNNMTPMTDDAIQKQSKLRNLRNEMITMKAKIASLEKQGINPTREHVQSHLNNIKSFTFHERPIGEAPRLVRKPFTVAPQPILIAPQPPKPILRNKPVPKLNSPPKSPRPTLRPSFLPRAPHIVVGRPQKPVVIHRKRPEKKGPKLVIVKVPTAKTKAAKTEKLSAMAELEDDIGGVLEGLTELAQRFPDDFASLMRAFDEEEKQEQHRAVTRNIQPSEIETLANIIAAGEKIKESRQKLNTKPSEIDLSANVMAVKEKMKESKKKTKVKPQEIDMLAQIIATEEKMRESKPSSVMTPSEIEMLAQIIAAEEKMRESTHKPNMTPSEIEMLTRIIAAEEETKMSNQAIEKTNKHKLNNAALCKKPKSPKHGKVLCNKEVLVPGSLCLLQCQHGWVPEGKELTRCTQAGGWTEERLDCVRPVAMLIGGFNVEEELLADVELYSPGGKCQGVKVAPLPGPRRGLVAAWVGGRVLACGGVNSTQQLNLCWQYQPDTNSWSETAPLHQERHFGSVVAASGSLVVLGGRDGTAQPMARGDMEQFQVDDLTWSPVKTKMTLERSYQCAVGLARDSLLVTGGYSWNSILARTETLNMTAGEGNRWSRLAPLLTPRYLHSCSPIELGGQGEVGVIVAGGYSSSYLNSTEIYRPDRDRWEAGGDMAVPRQGSSILVLEGKPTVLGGFHDYDQYPTLTEQYDHNLGFWFPLRRPLAKGRRYFGAVAVPETLFPGCV